MVTLLSAIVVYSTIQDGDVSSVSRTWKSGSTSTSCLTDMIFCWFKNWMDEDAVAETRENDGDDKWWKELYIVRGTRSIGLCSKPLVTSCFISNESHEARDRPQIYSEAAGVRRPVALHCSGY